MKNKSDKSVFDKLEDIAHQNKMSKLYDDTEERAYYSLDNI